MVRPREFNKDEALAQAMHAFWAKGYTATSLLNLIEAMGISKSSFYETFGSKHELFVTALDRYGDEIVRQVALRLEGAISPRQAIAGFFDMTVDDILTKEGRYGCLAINTAAELAAHDPEIAARVNAIFDRIADVLQKVISRGQVAGEIRADRQAGTLARYLMSTLTGLRVVGKAKQDRTALNDVVRVALSALDG
jgi:TetR/AcrR family transcriptional repressor of nem operon